MVRNCLLKIFWLFDEENDVDEEDEDEEDEFDEEVIDDEDVNDDEDDDDDSVSWQGLLLLKEFEDVMWFEFELLDVMLVKCYVWFVGIDSDSDNIEFDLFEFDDGK